MTNPEEAVVVTADSERRQLLTRMYKQISDWLDDEGRDDWWSYQHDYEEAFTRLTAAPPVPQGHDDAGEVQKGQTSHNQWRGIESAPKDGSNILIIAATAYSPQARVGWWNDGWQFYSRPSKPSGGGLTYMLEATHWMPLPAAPSADAAEVG